MSVGTAAERWLHHRADVLTGEQTTQMLPQIPARAALGQVGRGTRQTDRQTPAAGPTGRPASLRAEQPGPHAGQLPPGLGTRDRGAAAGRREGGE